ncbi:MAG: hypothetical protein ABIH34_06270 [Nanoarchaeota archaeon]
MAIDQKAAKIYEQFAKALPNYPFSLYFYSDIVAKEVVDINVRAILLKSLIKHNGVFICARATHYIGKTDEARRMIEEQLPLEKNASLEGIGEFWRLVQDDRKQLGRANRLAQEENHCLAAIIYGALGVEQEYERELGILFREKRFYEVLKIRERCDYDDKVESQLKQIREQGDAVPPEFEHIEMQEDEEVPSARLLDIFNYSRQRWIEGKQDQQEISSLLNSVDQTQESTLALVKGEGWSEAASRYRACRDDEIDDQKIKAYDDLVKICTSLAEGWNPMKTTRSK